MPPFIVWPKEKSEDPNDYSERNSTPRRPELTVLNLDVNPLKTEIISIKGHENHSAQNSHYSHDLTYQSFCKTHVSHGNVVLSSIAEINSRSLDAFRYTGSFYFVLGIRFGSYNDINIGTEGVIDTTADAIRPCHSPPLSPSLRATCRS
jgi:hypothetical protein